ncbi:hypothetical protein H4R33_002350 [Dimargaris cristalligena]|nr:hypothetical protein H4R33_002350 [Dimargaris cristalligena]
MARSMRRVSALLLNLLLALNIAQADVVPNSFIVQFPGTSYDLAVSNQLRASLVSDLKASSIPFILATNYSDVFAGSQVLVDEYYQTAISTFASVWKISPNQIMAQDSTMDLQARQSTTNAGLAQINHGHTGVSTLTSAYGLTGAGVKVGIIDSGIDYTHPAFGNCFNTTSCKVRYGYDLVGDAFTGYNTPQPKANPLDTCNGHGTHVAGIIAGNSGNFKGVAPGATLGVYRAMGCSTTTNSAILIKALQMAYVDGMKVINISIAAPSGFNSDIDAFCSDYMTAMGVAIIAAAGNEGQRSFWMTGSPATGRLVFTVGSMEPPTVYGYGLTFTNPTGVSPHIRSSTQGISKSFAFTNLAVLQAKTASGSLCACSAITTVLTGKIALVQVGECTFDVKAANVAATGAVAMIVYDIEDVPIQPPLFTNPNTIPTVRVGKVTGDKFIEWYGKGWIPRITSNDNYQVLNNPKANQVSSFSSRGPGLNMEMKPTIVAPGSNVYSTYPTNLGSYAILSGTSMASPYVAGCFALVFQYSPYEFVEQVTGLLVEHATVLFDSGKAYLPAIQGGGSLAMGKLFDDLRVRTYTSIPLTDLEAEGPIAGYQSFAVGIMNNGPATYTYSSLYFNCRQYTVYDSSKNLLMTPQTVADSIGITFINSPVSGKVTPNSIFEANARVTTTNIASNGYMMFGFFLNYTLVTGSTTLYRNYPIMGMKDTIARLPILPPPTAPGYPAFWGPANPPAAGALPTYTMLNKDNPGFTFQQIFNSAMLLINVASVLPDGTTLYRQAIYGANPYMRRNWNPTSNPYSWRFVGGIVNASTGAYEMLPSGTYSLQAKWLKPNRGPDSDADFVIWNSSKFIIQW